MLKILLPLVLALALCSPVFAGENTTLARPTPPAVVTSFRVMVYGMYPPTPTSGVGTWSEPVTIDMAYGSEEECAQRLKAVIRIVEELAARGIDLIDGEACVPIAQPR